jgi:UDP-N-acetylglucosamine acyltransferase
MSEAVPKTNIEIHPSAVVDESAVIGEGTEIGAFSYIGPNVVIGARNKIHSHVVIDGHTDIGDDNTIYQFASVGAAPQDLKYRGEASKLTIGNRNIVREYVTLQPGTEGGGMITSIEDSNLFMACTHVGHDCRVGSRNIFANSATVAGHVEIGDSILVGGLVGIHQFVRIGNFAMIAAGSMVNKDIPPYLMCQGDRAMLIGVHQVGLERNKFDDEQIREIKNFYKDIFLSKSESFKERIEVKSKEVENFDDALKGHLEFFCNFILASDRGIASVRKK